MTWQHGSNMEKQDELPEKTEACILMANGEQNFACRCERKIPAKKVFCVRIQTAGFLFRMLIRGRADKFCLHLNIK